MLTMLGVAGYGCALAYARERVAFQDARGEVDHVQALAGVECRYGSESQRGEQQTTLTFARAGVSGVVSHRIAAHAARAGVASRSAMRDAIHPRISLSTQADDLEEIFSGRGRVPIFAIRYTDELDSPVSLRTSARRKSAGR